MWEWMVQMDDNTIKHLRTCCMSGQHISTDIKRFPHMSYTSRQILHLEPNTHITKLNTPVVFYQNIGQNK